MRAFSSSPKQMILSLYQHRGLIRALIEREVVGRYRGSFLGILWSFFNPIFMLAVYTFVFSFVFKARWNSGSDSKTEFALVLFAGLIMFNLFSECISKAPSLILANANYVKKVVFPLEILPWVTVGSALFHAAISVIVWVSVYAVLFGVPHVSILLLPMILLPLIFLILGLTWSLASLGVYLRDVSQFIGIIITVLMFLSPIFYPVEALPEQYRYLLNLNPLTPVIEMARSIMFWGEIPGLRNWLIYLAGSFLVACLGFAWFQKTRKGFGDVL